MFLLLIGGFIFGNAYSAYFYKFGLYAYDFYFIVLIVMLLIDSFRGRVQIYKTQLLLPIFVLFVFMLAGSMTGEFDKYYARDIRPIIFLVECFLVSQFCNFHNELSDKKILLFIILASASNIFYLSLSYFHLSVFEDVYYSNNSFRYFDLSTYIASIFIAFSPLILKRIKSMGWLGIMAIMLAFCSVLASGSRTVVAITVIVFTLLYVNRPLRVFFLTIITGIAFGALTLIGNSKLFDRIFNTSLDTLDEEFKVRFSPFYFLLKDFDWHHYLIGRGFGTTFFIPWFENRGDHLDPINNFVDSTYLTLYAKFGVISFVIIYFYIRQAMLFIDHDQKAKILLIFYVLSMMTVFAIPYQASAIGLFLGLFAINSLAYHNDKDAINHNRPHL